jgi:hypothetical protein
VAILLGSDIPPSAPQWESRDIKCSQLPKGYGGVKQVTPPRLQGEWGYGDGSCDPTKWGYCAATLMHLDAGDTPEQALRRELLEETSWQPNELEFCMVHHIQGSVKPSVQA